MLLLGIGFIAVQKESEGKADGNTMSRYRAIDRWIWFSVGLDIEEVT